MSFAPEPDRELGLPFSIAPKQWWQLAPLATAAVVEGTAAASLNWQDLGMRLVWVLALIAINAFFVAAEFSMVAVRRSRIDQLVDAGDLSAKTVQDLQRHLDRLLSTTQIGITLSSLALGWIGERTLAVFVGVIISRLPLAADVRQILTHIVALPLAFLLLAYLQIVLGELCPKAVALLYSEFMARLLGPPSLVISRIFNPFVWTLNQSTRGLLRLFGVRYPNPTGANRVTPEELQRIIATEGESAGLEEEERELLNNVFEFGDVCADEVMVPRTSIVAIPNTATFQELLDTVASCGHSRYPIIGESLDDIRGIIDFKELARPLARGRLTLTSPVRPWIRPARFVPEYTRLSELLPMMQRSHHPMVAIVDEFGGTAGLVTLQDLIDRILGDRYEGEDVADSDVQIIEDGSFLVQAQLDIEEVNELLDLDLPITDDYQTLGGFVIFQMQKIPEIGETLTYENLEMTVRSADGPRLHQIVVYRREVPPQAQMLPETISDTEPETETEDPSL